MPDQTQAEEIRKLFDDYTRTWEAGDWNSVALLYSVPSVSMRGDGSIVCFQSRKELQEFFEGVASTRGELGPSRHQILTIQPIGARSVLATLNWQNFLIDGRPASEWRQSYNLVRIDGQWQIFVSTFHLE